MEGGEAPQTRVVPRTEGAHNGGRAQTVQAERRQGRESSRHASRRDKIKVALAYLQAEVQLERPQGVYPREHRQQVVRRHVVNAQIHLLDVRVPLLDGGEGLGRVCVVVLEECEGGLGLRSEGESCPLLFGGV